MIPSNRLLFWLAAVVIPLAIVGGTIEAFAAPVWGLILAAAVLVIVDAVISSRRLLGVSISFPEVVRLRKDATESVPLQIVNETMNRLVIRIGVALPAPIEPLPETLRVALPEGIEHSKSNWTCVASVRGRYPLTIAMIEAASYLGFWQIRRRIPLSSEFRVYPNLLPERRNVSALFLTRGRTGIRAQRAAGKGRDFEKLRDYVPGDSYEDIHWRASAKRGHPVTKIYQIERTQEIYVIVDSSRLAGRVDPFSDPPASMLERYLTAALVLGMAAEQQGDLYGLVTFSDRVETYLPARGGKKHYDTCRDAIYTLQPKVVTPNFEDLATFIRTKIRKRSLLFVLTSLDDPVLAENFVQSMELVSRRHLVLVNMPKPVAANPVFSSSEVSDMEDIYEALGGHLLWHELRELGKVLQRRGIRFSLLEREKMTADLVSQYLDVKSRQLL